MARNENLHAANKAKNDEFYTQFPDIANELKHYREHFRGKIVFCNCDDPYESNFFKYFALNFNQLGLKKLIATCYDGSPIANTQLQLFDDSSDAACHVPTEKNRTAYKIVITEVTDANSDGAIDLSDVEWLIRNNHNILTKLKGNGDFRSTECIELLKEADIVVTNPPFSLFREYVAQLVQYQKKFIILGNMNAVTNKDFFPLIRNNNVWIGYGFNLSMVFKTTYPNKLEANRKYVRSKGYDPDQNYVKTPAIAWYTNLDINKRHENLILYKHYTPEEFPKYDNYEAINVDKVSDIPMDYNGVMGVPLTFLDKYNPSQFEILWQACGNTRVCAPTEILRILNYSAMKEDRGGCALLNGQRVYTRILIRRRQKAYLDVEGPISMAAEK
jgi:hypothetical protein